MNSGQRIVISVVCFALAIVCVWIGPCQIVEAERMVRKAKKPHGILDEMLSDVPIPTVEAAIRKRERLRSDPAAIGGTAGCIVFAGLGVVVLLGKRKQVP